VTAWEIIDMKLTTILAAALVLAPAALFASAPARDAVRHDQFVTLNPEAASELATALLAAPAWPSNKIVIPGHGADSVLVKALQGSVQPRMPLRAPPLTDAAIAAVKAWIDHGASEAEFTSTVAPIFKQSCNGCHSTQSHAAGLVMDTFGGLVNSVNGH